MKEAEAFRESVQSLIEGFSEGHFSYEDSVQSLIEAFDEGYITEGELEEGLGDMWRAAKRLGNMDVKDAARGVGRAAPKFAFKPTEKAVSQRYGYKVGQNTIGDGTYVDELGQVAKKADRGSGTVNRGTSWNIDREKRIKDAGTPAPTRKPMKLSKPSAPAPKAVPAGKARRSQAEMGSSSDLTTYKPASPRAYTAGSRVQRGQNYSKGVGDTLSKSASSPREFRRSKAS